MISELAISVVQSFAPIIFPSDYHGPGMTYISPGAVQRSWPCETLRNAIPPFPHPSPCHVQLPSWAAWAAAADAGSPTARVAMSRCRGSSDGRRDGSRISDHRPARRCVGTDVAASGRAAWAGRMFACSYRLPACLLVCLASYLPTCPPTYLSTYLSHLRPRVVPWRQHLPRREAAVSSFPSGLVQLNLLTVRLREGSGFALIRRSVGFLPRGANRACCVAALTANSLSLRVQFKMEARALGSPTASQPAGQPSRPTGQLVCVSDSTLV